MTIFRSRGFDTLIGKGTVIMGVLSISTDTTAVIDGQAFMTDVNGRGESLTNKDQGKTTLHVNGQLAGPGGTSDVDIEVQNVIVTGKVSCNEIRVEGTLAVKSGATLKATKILYRELIIETGAVVHGQMFHLDHVSEGEQV